MTHKWIIKSASGSFVQTEPEVVSRFGQEVVNQMKEEVSEKIFPQVERKVENTKIVCIRTF